MRPKAYPLCPCAPKPATTHLLVEANRSSIDECEKSPRARQRLRLPRHLGNRSLSRGNRLGVFDRLPASKEDPPKNGMLEHYQTRGGTSCLSEGELTVPRATEFLYSISEKSVDGILKQGLGRLRFVNSYSDFWEVESPCTEVARIAPGLLLGPAACRR